MHQPRTGSRSRLQLVALLAAAAILGASATPLEAQSFDFEWIGKIELDAQNLDASDVKKRREAVAALGKYDIAITAPYFLRALRDPDPRVRADAGRLLGKHRVLEATPTIIQWLNEPDPILKQEAAGILADLGTEEAIQALIRSLGDPDERVRERAATALGKVGTSQVVVPLIGRLEDDKSDVRRAAIAQLAVIADRRAVIPLAGAFNDGNLEVRKAAISAVGHLGDPAPVPALLRLLRDPVEDIKQAAVTSLGNLHAIAATSELIEELGRGSDSYQSKVAYALGRIAREAARGDEPARQAADRALRALVSALATRGVRSAASEALRHAGAAAVPALIAHLDGEIEGDLATAIELLRDIRDLRATPALITELDRGRINQRLVLEALSHSGDQRALMPILRLLASRDADVRLQAMNALRPIIHDLRAADVLADLLRDPDLEIRVLAAEYLGLMRSRSAVPRLIELIGADPAPRLARAAVDALGEIGDARAAGALLELLASGPAHLHRDAASALIYIGEASSVDRLLALARDRQARNREHVVRALGGVLRDHRHAAARALLETLARTEGRVISLAAIEALGAMRDPASAPALLDVARGDGHRRRAALTQLGNLGQAAAVPALIDALDASDDRISGDAAWALGKLASAQALEPLLHATRRRGWATAINASAALARYAPASQAEKLAGLLYHRSRLVRANAAVGLGRMWPEVPASARPAVERALVMAMRKDASWLVRASAARTLSRVPGARGSLAELGKIDRDQRVREAAQAALARPFEPSARTDWRSFHVVDPDRDDAPVRQEPYFLIAADGLITALYTDARGMAGEEQFPPGDHVLEPRAKELRY